MVWDHGGMTYSELKQLSIDQFEEAYQARHLYITRWKDEAKRNGGD